WKRFTALNTRKWIDLLPTLLTKYNNTKHSTIKMTPTEASMTKNESLLLAQQQQQEPAPSKTTKFNLGEKVRISRIKGVFEQGYLPNWSEELFEIIKVKNTYPTTYVLKDANGKEIGGSFYNEELQKATQEIYRIEKIIRKKKIKGVEYGLVKWIGYSDKFNTWEPMTEIINLNN
ncbi:MAG TPA: chromo domain-containing protein, partial [Aquella sp.]|nr:chromo domain-containing protein [Aquella sp.]